MTDQPTEEPRWEATSASSRGSSHTGSMPNQDAVLVERVPGDRLVAAVSDGHGGPRYVRSHIGSRLAVRVARDAVVEACEAEDPRSPGQVLRELVPTIVRRWREAVDTHLAGNALTDEEAALADDVTTRPYDAYGATLLLALVSPDGVGIAQIGDGDALLRVNGFATRPMPSDDRLVAGMTTSLCLETAEHDFRFSSVPGSAEVDLVMLATDGYGNSFASGDWWRTLVDDLAWFVHRHGFGDLDEQLPSWLDESAQVGGDDVTVACLVLDPFAVPAVDPALTAAAKAESPAPTPAPVAAAAAATGAEEWGGARPAATVAEEQVHGTTRVDEVPAAAPAPRRRTAVAVALAALLAVVVGAGAWAAMRDGSPDPAPTPTAPVSSPTTPTTSSSGPAVKPDKGGGGKKGGRPGRKGDGGKPKPDPLDRPQPDGNQGDSLG